MSEAWARIITCKNSKGNSITVNEKEFNPFLLCSAEGIYDTNNTVFTTENTVIDGSEYQGSVMQTRNIILTLKEIDNNDVNREIIDQIFSKGEVGTLTVEDESHTRSIEYYVESVITTATPLIRLTTISLICPDPHFYDPYTYQILISDLISDFEFIHEFLDEGEEFGYYNDLRYGVIINDSADLAIGMTIVIKATGHVVNPKIVKIETRENIILGTQESPFTMEFGDILTIVTLEGQKNVFLNGTAINQHLTANSTFLQITRGRNSFGYDADEGIEYMAMTIYYRYKYQRA